MNGLVLLTTWWFLTRQENISQGYYSNYYSNGLKVKSEVIESLDRDSIPMARGPYPTKALCQTAHDAIAHPRPALMSKTVDIPVTACTAVKGWGKVE